VQTNAVMAKETNFHQGFDTHIETWKSEGFKQNDEFPEPLDRNTAQSVILTTMDWLKENISKYVVLAAAQGTFSILDDTWKLTHFKKPHLIEIMGGKEHLLFNYREDAEERINLYSEGDNKIEAQERLKHVLSD
jgi:hypothetical protein